MLQDRRSKMVIGIVTRSTQTALQTAAKKIHWHELTWWLFIWGGRPSNSGYIFHWVTLMPEGDRRASIRRIIQKMDSECSPHVCVGFSSGTPASCHSPGSSTPAALNRTKQRLQDDGWINKSVALLFQLKYTNHGGIIFSTPWQYCVRVYSFTYVILNCIRYSKMTQLIQNPVRHILEKLGSSIKTQKSLKRIFKDLWLK